jgi:hypothetical protein
MNDFLVKKSTVNITIYPVPDGFDFSLSCLCILILSIIHSFTRTKEGRKDDKDALFKNCHLQQNQLFTRMTQHMVDEYFDDRKSTGRDCTEKLSRKELV